MAKIEQHTLTLTARGQAFSETAAFDGSCSCERWTMRNHPKAAIRVSHGEHVQAHLGPDASERDSRTNKAKP